MSKPCCETGEPKQTPSWKVWLKRAVYFTLVIIIIFLIYEQIQPNS